jgi:YD repeat-containing protein
MNPNKTPRIKVALRIITLSAVVFFVALQVLVWRRTHPSIRMKSASELAKLPVSTDSYPCLRVDRGNSSELHASLQQCLPALNNDVAIEQYEVDLRYGAFILRKTDLFVPDRMPIALTRAYRSGDRHSRAFGNGSHHPFDIFPYGDQFPYTYMELLLGDDHSIHYSRTSEGTSYVDFVAEHSGTADFIFQKSQVRWRGDHWELHFRDGTVYRFPDAYRAKRGVEGALTGMRNPQGDEITFLRDPRHNLISLTSPRRHQLRFAYDDRDRVSDASDDSGNSLRYSYNPNGDLSEVSQGDQIKWLYSYDTYGMTRVQDSDKHDVLVNEYSLGRISSMTIENIGTYNFNYLVTRTGKIEGTMVTDPAGKQTIFRF